MAELPKVMYDDHQRLERMFARYTTTQKSDYITGLMDELDIVLTTAEELALPVVNRLNPGLAEQMDAEQQKLRDLAAEVTEFEPGDPGIKAAMKRLERMMLVHINHVEKSILPLLRTAVHRGELHELGRNAFALRQEMLGQLDFRPRFKQLGEPGSGWGGRGTLDPTW